MKKLLFVMMLLALPMIMNAQDLKNYAGTYTFEGGAFSKVLVTVENGKLYGFEQEAGKHELKPTTTADTYSIDGMDGQFVFVRNSSKVVDKTIIKVEGQTFEGKRWFPAKADYAGVYVMTGAPFEKLIITEENGTLQADAPGVGKGEITITTNIDEFHEPNNDAVIAFKRDNDVVTSVVILVQGAQLPGKKEVAGSEYVGKYVFAQGSPIDEVIVELKNGKLVGTSSQGSAELKPTSKKDEYEVVGYDGKATFKRDSTQKISGLTLYIQETNMEAQKK